MKHAPAGFTLLEIMVALVIFGFIVVGLVQGVEFGISVSDRQTIAVASTTDIDTIDRLLRVLVLQMDPSSPLLIARSSNLEFTTNLDAGGASLAVEADISLGVTADHRFVLRWTPHLHATLLSQPNSFKEVTLLSGIKGVSFSYCCSREEKDNQWRNTWTAKDLPNLVRIQLYTDNYTTHEWPPIIANTIRMRLNG